MVQVVPDNEVAPQQPHKQKQGVAATLSKTWSIASAHVPTFSGGKITQCHTQGLLTKVIKNDEGDDEGDATEAEEQHVPFLILPIDGDLALVDARKGTKIKTVRQNEASQFEDDEEDDAFDNDAIVAHALSHNDSTIMTCSRNQLIRQYSLPNLELVKLWGRSGHTLPVTRMVFHVSNIFLATASVDGAVRIWDVRGAFVRAIDHILAIE